MDPVFAISDLELVDKRHFLDLCEIVENPKKSANQGQLWAQNGSQNSGHRKLISVWISTDSRSPTWN